MKAIGTEPIVVTMTAMPMGMALFLKRCVNGFCKVSEKMREQMYEARGTAAMAYEVS